MSGNGDFHIAETAVAAEIANLILLRSMKDGEIEPANQRNRSCRRILLPKDDTAQAPQGAASTKPAKGS